MEFLLHVAKTREQQEIDKEGRKEKATPQPCPPPQKVTRGENDNVKSAMDDDEEEVVPPTHVFDVILIDPSFPSLFFWVGRWGGGATHILDGGSDERIFGPKGSKKKKNNCGKKQFCMLNMADAFLARFLPLLQGFFLNHS